MKKIRSRQIWWLILILVLMIGIFISSSMTYHQQSLVPFLKRYWPKQLGYPLLRKIDFVYGDKRQAVATVGYYKLIEFGIRKLAHLSVFGMLGIVGTLFLKNEVKHWHLAPWLSWLSTTGLAGLDEFHQLLTSGRSPLIQDVMLDSLGAFIGAGLTYIFLWLWQLWRKRC